MKTRIIENSAIAFYLSFVTACATAVYWWYSLSSKEIFVGWCICLAVFFVAVSGLRTLIERGLRIIEWRATHKAIKYDARGYRQDANHLGYISAETICDIGKMGRRNDK